MEHNEDQSQACGRDLHRKRRTLLKSLFLLWFIGASFSFKCDQTAILRPLDTGTRNLLLAEWVLIVAFVAALLFGCEPAWRTMRRRALSPGRRKGAVRVLACSLLAMLLFAGFVFVDQKAKERLLRLSRQRGEVGWKAGKS